MEMLSQNIEWWHWIVLGVILIIVEMGIGTFFLLGLGVSSVSTGLVDALFDTSFTTNLIIWIMLSSIFIFAWKKYFKNPTYSESGQSDYGLSTRGIVSQDIEPSSRGEVTLEEPLIGNVIWPASSSSRISKGSKIKIIKIKGQLLIVEPA